MELKQWVVDNLGENNPEFSEFTENLGEQYMSQPPALSVGVHIFLGANYAFLWGMAMANPAMRRHFNDFNIAMLPGIIPQFPIKTFTYRILNDKQTQFEFDFGLDASALMEAFNEGVSWPGAGMAGGTEESRSGARASA